MATEKKKKEQTELSKAITERIRQFMKEKGETMNSLAEKIGVTAPAVLFHLNGNPSLDVLERIATALGVSMWDMMPIEADYVPYARRTDGLFAEEKAEDAPKVMICPRCGQRFQMLPDLEEEEADV